MDFVFKNFSSVLKILLILIAIFIFIRIIPLLVAVGVVVFACFKVKKYLKNRKMNKSVHSRKSNAGKAKKDSFDFHHGKIIDVDYDEVEK
ncbi:hypothetical protein [Clostridium luticellarii]|uniref:DUF4834 domain-containing protein n=1 Tax=Clostridium luticellarii TaxID=1691940 RepID=A0A2T0BLG7_9CLOT|nr:hypothetical protein [Clostridium luticellarii]MCI1944361.1 hypothetical protein [Clostridium luticellarii]MCI1967481.1 hypothetical protein [Clostridium luticellarii]MCI1994993.1 hypothetical protein [Clostridium luticellarii]MCI2039568.1 hypothetical protein [Clostridium luticellarii]PRR84683.1 hypothetical protein CLLU_23670 [Clostridium luticellarii]